MAPTVLQYSAIVSLLIFQQILTKDTPNLTCEMRYVVSVLSPKYDPNLAFGIS